MSRELYLSIGGYDQRYAEPGGGLANFDFFWRATTAASVVFALLTITIACHAGLSVTGGAEGVGRSTTQSVVYSLLAMLISDTIMTALFYVVF